MADVQVIKEAIGELDESLVMQHLNSFIETKPSKEATQEVVAACQQGMEIVGVRFDAGEYFTGDLIFAGELLTTCFEMLKPFVGKEAGENRGTIVLGTVEGDIHDIGKNIFKSLSEAAGFEVIDLGIDQSPAAFVSEVQKINPQIVGFSGVLTLAIDSMKKTVDALTEAGLRDKVKIAIGGNAVNEEVCRHVGADAWSKNAAEAVKICREWV